MFAGLSVDCFLLVCGFVFGVFACGEGFLGVGLSAKFLYYTVVVLLYC